MTELVRPVIANRDRTQNQLSTGRQIPIPGLDVNREEESAMKFKFDAVFYYVSNLRTPMIAGSSQWFLANAGTDVLPKIEQSDVRIELLRRSGKDRSPSELGANYLTP